MDDYDLRNRTNNALERYNRRINSLFLTPRPSLALFVTKIEEESRAQVIRLEDIRYGRVVPQEPNEDNIISTIPPMYSNYETVTDQNVSKWKGLITSIRLFEKNEIKCVS